MNTALAGTALLLGIAGAPHCAAMCGAACQAAAGACGGRSLQANLVSLHLARGLAYVAAGAVAATGVNLLGGVPALRPLWSLAQAAALALGLWLLVQGREPEWLTTLRVRPLRPSQGKVIWIGGPGRAALVGGAWVALPCGLLQSALVVAALGNGPADGAALMALFAATSAVGLWAGPALWARLKSVPFAPSWGTRLAGAMLMVASGWALWHGTVMGLPPDACAL
jgi:uncharacterized protein